MNVGKEAVLLNEIWNVVAQKFNCQPIKGLSQGAEQRIVSIRHNAIKNSPMLIIFSAQAPARST
jgi:hypothetical protein